MISIVHLLPQLLQSRQIVITMHQKPDADALGSSLGLYHVLKTLGHNVSVLSPTNWPSFLNWMPGIDIVIDAENKREFAAELIQRAEIIFCLDFNTLSRTKGLEPEIKQSSAIRVLIDHHQEPDTNSFAFGVSDTGKSSTAEMVYDFIIASGFEHFINIPVAQCIYAGVMTDTGSFRFPSTTASVHRLVADLIDRGLQHHLIHDQVFDIFLENRLVFFGHVLLNRMDINYELNTVLIAIPKADLVRFQIKTGDTDGLVNYPLSIQGIKMVAIVIDRDEERKWSFRSKGNVDVNTFARQFFEGGGHRNAAGGRSAESLESTIAKFHKVLPAMSADLMD